METETEMRICVLVLARVCTVHTCICMWISFVFFLVFSSLIVSILMAQAQAAVPVIALLDADGNAKGKKNKREEKQKRWLHAVTVISLLILINIPGVHV
jgi:hypothetical protein